MALPLGMQTKSPFEEGPFSTPPAVHYSYPHYYTSEGLGQSPAPTKKMVGPGLGDDGDDGDDSDDNEQSNVIWGIDFAVEKLVTASIILAATWAWKEFLVSLVGLYLGDGNQLSTKFLVASIFTVVAVFVLMSVKKNGSTSNVNAEDNDD